jgi:hypothetical protein
MNNEDTTRNFGCAYNAVIKLNYSENIKIRPDISVTRENQSVEIKIKIDLGKRKENHDIPDYRDVNTPQEMVEKYKLRNDISSMVKPCW